MPILVQVYVEESAQGNIPDRESPEGQAYREWSRKETARRIVLESCLKVYGSGYYLLGSMV
jgi:hypothetical protein